MLCSVKISDCSVKVFNFHPTNCRVKLYKSPHIPKTIYAKMFAMSQIHTKKFEIKTNHLIFSIQYHSKATSHLHT